jgi:hypothetical protein
MQQLKTLTVKTTNKVKSVHADTVYAIMYNCFKNLAFVDADCTGSSYYVNSANIFAELQSLYCSFASTTEYTSLDNVMQCFTNNITYTDESSLYTQAVENTALEKVKLENYTYLSN